VKRIVLLLVGLIVAAELVLRIPVVWTAVSSALPQGPGEVETLLKRPGGVDSLQFVRDPELGTDCHGRRMRLEFAERSPQLLLYAIELMKEGAAVDFQLFAA